MGKRRILQDKTCKYCGQPFRPYGRIAKYCSYACFNRDGDSRRKGKKIKCLVCGKEIYARLSIAGSVKYCSYGCMGRAKLKGGKLICKVCGEEYHRPPSQIMWRGTGYCSNKCKSNSFRVAKPKRRVLDQIWAKTVKLMAGKKCEYCGSSEHIQSHHLFGRTNLTTRWVIENGVCLCALHHRFGGFSAHNAPLEFTEWIKESRGIVWYENLRYLAKQVNKKTREELASDLYAAIDKYKQTPDGAGPGEKRPETFGALHEKRTAERR